MCEKLAASKSKGNGLVKQGIRRLQRHVVTTEDVEDAWGVQTEK